MCPNMGLARILPFRELLFFCLGQGLRSVHWGRKSSRMRWLAASTRRIAVGHPRFRAAPWPLPWAADWMCRLRHSLPGGWRETTFERRRSRPLAAPQRASVLGWCSDSRARLWRSAFFWTLAAIASYLVVYFQILKKLNRLGTPGRERRLQGNKLGCWKMTGAT